MVPLRRLEKVQEALLKKRTNLLSKTGSNDASHLEKFLGRSFSEPKKKANISLLLFESWCTCVRKLYLLWIICRTQLMQSWRASFLFVCSVPFTLLTEDWKSQKVNNDCSFPFLTYFDTYCWRGIFVSPYLLPLTEMSVEWLFCWS